MDYEKAYKEALEKARQFSERPLEEDSSSIVEYIFPELKEIEDEKIRKWLIDWAKAVNWSEQFTVTKEQVLAWLEKQGKQKVSYTTIVETGNGGINTLVTGELPIDGEQNPIEFKWSADDKNKLLIIEQILNCANLLISSQELTETKNWLNSLKQRIGE